MARNGHRRRWGALNGTLQNGRAIDSQRRFHSRLLRGRLSPNFVSVFDEVYTSFSSLTVEQVRSTPMSTMVPLDGTWGRSSHLNSVTNIDMRP